MSPLPRNLRPVAVAIGRRIAVLRAERGMTQAELAARVDSSSTVISRVETGVELSSVPRLVAIARALGVPVRELFEAAPAASDDPREAAVAEIAVLLRGASAADAERAVDVVRALLKR